MAVGTVYDLRTWSDQTVENYLTAAEAAAALRDLGIKIGRPSPHYSDIHRINDDGTWWREAGVIRYYDEPIEGARLWICLFRDESEAAARTLLKLAKGVVDGRVSTDHWTRHTDGKDRGYIVGTFSYQLRPGRAGSRTEGGSRELVMLDGARYFSTAVEAVEGPESADAAATFTEVLSRSIWTTTPKTWGHLQPDYQAATLIRVARAQRTMAPLLLAEWILGDVDVIVVAGIEEVTEGFAVIGYATEPFRTGRGKRAAGVRREVFIAGEAPFARVDAELWDMVQRYSPPGDTEFWWWGPDVKPCAPWCDEEHDLLPDSECRGSLYEGRLQSGAYLTIDVVQRRNYGRWDGPPTVVTTGELGGATPAEAAKFAARLVKASDIAAGLYVAAAVEMPEVA